MRRIGRSMIISVTIFASAASGQVTPEEHASHHPPAPPAASGTPAPQPQDAMQGMEQMMEGMHGPPPKQLYPSLIDLPALPPERREEVQRAAHERMESGTRLMAEGLDQLVRSAPGTDYAAMQDAVAKLREGLARFDSGLAAHRALAEGNDPRALAMQWFKSQMNLPGPPPPAETHGLWGFSWAHLAAMVLLTAFAAAMIAMYFLKMRRAAALLKQLATAPPRSWGGSLRVTRVFNETPQIKTFRLVDAAGGPIPFNFLAGQFLTLTAAHDGRTAKRAYTIASSPAQRDYVEITVKREENGLVSRLLCDQTREGALLQVAAPQGVFTFTGAEADSIVLIGAGVGATPLMSVVRYLTDRGWGKPIYLVLGFRSPEDFLFRTELEYLQSRHPYLRVVATVSRPEGSSWTGPTGRVTNELIGRSVPEVAKRRVHVCGPPAMMDATRAMLLELGVAPENIRIEAFGPAEKVQDRQAAVQAAMAGAPAASTPTVSFTISGKTAPLPPDTSVLEAAEHVGVSIDYSCRVGTCGLCKVKLLQGHATMAVEDALAAEEKARGIILACQAKSNEHLEVEA